MPGPQKIGAGGTQQIVGPGKMLLFIAGLRPIYGTQILYFMDPEMKKRTEIPPPTKFPRLTTVAVPRTGPDKPLKAIQQPTPTQPTAASQSGEKPIIIASHSDHPTTTGTPVSTTVPDPDYERDDEEIAL